MTIGKGKRPRDTNQLAKFIVDATTGQIDVTPAMEAGLTDHVWSLQELLGLVKL